MRWRRSLILAAAAACLMRRGAALPAADARAIDIGDRRELFVDDYLTQKQDHVELRLHPPIRREIVFTFDAPWEGSGCGYETVFRDGDVVRMYYIAADLTNRDGTVFAHRPLFACYAESRDGIRWTKPELGLFEFAGSKRNNTEQYRVDGEESRQFHAVQRSESRLPARRAV